MTLFKVEWRLATTLAVYGGTYIVHGDDDDHAMQIVRCEIGPEGQAANLSVERVGGRTFQIKRSEKLLEAEQYAPTPVSYSRDLYAWEIAARANVVASSEKIAFTRLSKAIQAGADGKYCTLLKTAVLEKESMSKMSREERHSLSKSFIRVSGGGVNPR
jgi:hypothetical protein